MSIYDDIAGAVTVTIPEGAVKKITRKTEGVLIWEKPESISAVLNDNDWATIREVSDAGQAANYWNVGDRKGVYLNGTAGSISLNGTWYCYIIGFDHNSSREGTNRIHFQFGYTALSGGKQITFYSDTMNPTQTNNGGWNSSYLRTTAMVGYKNCMPLDLQSVLKTVTKYSDNTGGGSDTASYVTATTDTVFLLAEYEVFGSRTRANSAEQNYQAQYAYYSAGNSKVRYKHSSTDASTEWWLRSVRHDRSEIFCDVTYSGGGNYMYANYRIGVAPAFCV